jgi:hypothetical protein
VAQRDAMRSSVERVARHEERGPLPRRSEDEGAERATVELDADLERRHEAEGVADDREPRPGAGRPQVTEVDLGARPVGPAIAAVVAALVAAPAAPEELPGRRIAHVDHQRSLLVDHRAAWAGGVADRLRALAPRQQCAARQPHAPRHAPPHASPSGHAGE